MNVYKFVNWEVPDIKELESSKISIAVKEADKGNLKPLKEMYQQCNFGIEHLVKGCYKLQGYLFDISDYCKTYLVKFRYENVYREYQAPNKTCLYNSFGKYNIIDCIEK